MDGFVAFVLLITLLGFAGVFAAKIRWRSSRRAVLSSYGVANGFETAEGDGFGIADRLREFTDFQSLDASATIQRGDDFVFEFSGYGNGPGMVEWRQTVFASRLAGAVDGAVSFMFRTTAGSFVNHRLFRLCDYEDNRDVLLPDVQVYVAGAEICRDGFVKAVCEICSKQGINVVVGGGMVFLFKQSKLSSAEEIDDRLSLLHDVANLISKAPPLSALA